MLRFPRASLITITFSLFAIATASFTWAGPKRPLTGCDLDLKNLARTALNHGFSVDGSLTDQISAAGKFMRGAFRPASSTESVALELPAQPMANTSSMIHGNAVSSPANVDDLKPEQREELARQMIYKSLELTYGTDHSSWRTYQPTGDELDSWQRSLPHIFADDEKAQIPDEINRPLADELRNNFTLLERLRSDVASQARHLGDKYVDQAWAAHLEDLTTMIQNSHGSSWAKFLQPLFPRVIENRLQFKQVLTDSYSLYRAQSDLFVGTFPLRNLPSLAGSARYREFQKSVDIAFFRKYTEELAPKGSPVLATFDAIIAGEGEFAEVPQDVRAALKTMRERLADATSTLQESRQVYSRGYRAAMYNLDFLSRLGSPTGDKVVGRFNVLRGLDQNTLLNSGEVHPDLYDAAKGIIESRQSFLDLYYNYEFQGISREVLNRLDQSVTRLAGSAAATLGPRIFSVVLTSERMEYEFGLGMRADLEGEKAALAQRARGNSLSSAAGVLTKLTKSAIGWFSKVYPALKAIPTDELVAALDKYRDALKDQGFSNSASVSLAAIPADTRDFLTASHSDEYTRADLSIAKMLERLTATLGPLSTENARAMEIPATLREEVTAAIVTDQKAGILRPGAPFGEGGTEQAILHGGVVIDLPAQEPNSQAPVANPRGAELFDRNNDGVVALREKLENLSERAAVLMRMDRELGIREIQALFNNANGGAETTTRTMLKQIQAYRATWSSERARLFQKIERVNDGLIASMTRTRDKGTALSTLADALPTELRDFMINSGDSFPEKLMPLHIRVILAIQDDLNPVQLFGPPAANAIAAGAKNSSGAVRTVMKRNAVVCATLVGLALGGAGYYCETHGGFWQFWAPHSNTSAPAASGSFAPNPGLRGSR